MLIDADFDTADCVMEDGNKDMFLVILAYPSSRVIFLQKKSDKQRIELTD